MLANKRIFDNRPRSEMGYSEEAQPIFDFIDNSAKPEFAIIRKSINTLFEKYPDIQKREIAIRLKSNDNETFISAYFELFSFHFLSRLGETLPNIQNNNVGRKNDFQCLINGNKICFESTVVYESNISRSEADQRSKIIDYINKKGKVSGFSYDFQIEKSGRNDPPMNRFAREITAWVQTHDQKTLRQNLEDDSNYVLPEKIFDYSEWIFKVRLIPKKIGIDESTHRAIGIGPITGGWRSDSESLYNSIAKKAKHYKNIGNRPFFLLCNSMLSIGLDDIDIMDALFGKEVYIYNPTTEEGRSDRKPDGVWRGPRGAINRSLNGVIFFDRLMPWNAFDVNPVLYLNPWSRNKNETKWWKWKKREADLSKKTYNFDQVEEYKWNP